MSRPSNDKSSSSDYALSRALLDAVLTPLTPEEVEQGRLRLEERRRNPPPDLEGDDAVVIVRYLLPPRETPPEE